MAVSEKDLANIEEVEDEAKLPVSAIQEINPGFLDRPQVRFEDLILRLIWHDCKL